MTTTESLIARKPLPGLGRLLGWPARRILALMGWRLDSPPPALSHYVMVGAFHTTNMDGVLLILFGLAGGMRVNFLMKDSFFRGPMGPLFRWLGGIAIDRSRRHNVVAQVAALFAAQEHLIIAISPEGTRSRTPHWKSGFYHIAREAGVPIVPSYLDYARKRGGFGAPIPADDDPEVVMAALREFYAAVTPRHPEKAGPVALRPR